MAFSGLLSLPNLILAGDLNLTLNASEIWGTRAQLDPLGPFFSKLFSDHHLVDVAPSYAGPTWRNGRMGEEGISKRLDCFWFPISSLALFPDIEFGIIDVGFQITSLFCSNGGNNRILALTPTNSINIGYGIRILLI